VTILVTTFIITILFAFLFGRIFHIPLPRGIGFIRDISSLLY
jgi:hypothetical protein